MDNKNKFSFWGEYTGYIKSINTKFDKLSIDFLTNQGNIRANFLNVIFIKVEYNVKETSQIRIFPLKNNLELSEIKKRMESFYDIYYENIETIMIQDKSYNLLIGYYATDTPFFQLNKGD